MNLDKLNEFMVLEREKCPWATSQTMEDLIREINGELLELTEELIKTPKNKNNVAEELADVFSDILLLIHIAERDNQIVSKQDIVQKALDKKLRRKGWLVEGKKLSREEASKYWYSAKESEKVLEKNLIEKK